MKKLILLLAAVSSLSIRAQNPNLVPNGSFENYSTCPFNYSQIQFAIGWNKSTINNNGQNSDHTDFIHACAPAISDWSIPTNKWGTETPCDGLGYAALCPMYPEYGVDYRENIYIKLNSPMQVGVPYYVSFCISLADYFAFATNNIGVKFSMTSNFSINNFAHLKATSPVVNKNGWVTVQGIVTPTQPFEYLGIGNFFTDLNTISVQIDQNPWINQAAMYYLDNIIVQKVCGWVDVDPGDPSDPPIEKILNNNSSHNEVEDFENTVSQDAILFECSPSIVENIFTVELNAEKLPKNCEIEIYDQFQSKVKTLDLSSLAGNNYTIDLSGVIPGVYTCTLKYNNQVLKYQKIIKQ